MEIGVEGAKYGMTGQMGHATKSGVTLFGGHSGMGMLMAVEIAKAKDPLFITTVSKRGRPNAPGPAKSFIESMSSTTTHFMAACDENDAKAVECLMDWAPPASSMPVNTTELDPLIDPNSFIQQTRTDLSEMSPAKMHGTLKKLEELKLDVMKGKRDIRTRMAKKEFASYTGAVQQSMREQLLAMDEAETSILELIADIQGNVDTAPTALE